MTPPLPSVKLPCFLNFSLPRWRWPCSQNFSKYRIKCCFRRIDRSSLTRTNVVKRCLHFWRKADLGHGSNPNQMEITSTGHVGFLLNSSWVLIYTLTRCRKPGSQKMANFLFTYDGKDTTKCIGESSNHANLWNNGPKVFAVPASDFYALNQINPVGQLVLLAGSWREMLG